MKKFKIYFKLLQAGVKEDMAKRIMYSIIPSVSSPAEIAGTGGMVSYHALRAAVEGRKKLILYGTRAAVQELENSKNISIHPKALNLSRNKDYEGAIDIAIEDYSNPDHWRKGFGGIAWLNISKCIKRMMQLDKSLDKIREQPPSAERQQQEIDIMKDLVVEMNIFDGLSHNTDSIIRNVLEIENWAERPKDKPYILDSKKEFEKDNQVRLLMDAKELQSPLQVFKSIEKVLEEGGSILPFKEYIQKLRSDPQYSKIDPLISYEMFMIRLRKRIGDQRRHLYKSLDELQGKLNEAEEKYNSMIETSWIEEEDLKNYFDALNDFHYYELICANDLGNLIYGIINNLKNEYISISLSKESAIKISDAADKILKEIDVATKKLREDIYAPFALNANYISDINSDQSTKENVSLKKHIKAAMDKLLVVKRIVFLFDSI